MDSGSLRQLGKTQSWPRARQALWYTVAGSAVTLVTVILSALDAVSPQQAIAMALPSAVITVGGLIGMTVPDAWTAWRRGFRQGCEAAMRCQPDGLTADVNAEACREGRLAAA